MTSSKPYLISTWEPLSGKPVGGRLADGSREANREAAQPDTRDGDAETSPFVGRRSVPDYVKPEPTAKALSPTREVLAVIEVEGGSHV